MRLEIACHSMASDELIQTLHHRDANAETLVHLQELLRLHDAQTFAGHTITMEEMRGSLEHSLCIVDWSVSQETGST